MKRGDIYYLRYDNGYGHEMAVGRPVVIVASKEGIATSPIVQVVYMTTSRRDYSDCYKLTSSNRDTWVVCNQLNTVDKRRLQSHQGCVTDEEMQEIDKRLKLVLGLEDESLGMSEPLVPVVEPVDISEIEEECDDSIELRVEMEMYKKLYEKALEKLIDLKLEKDTRVQNKSEVIEDKILKLIDERVASKEKEKEEHKLSDEEISGMMSQLEEAGLKQPKKGRPVGSKNKTEEVKVPWNAKREDIIKYANPKGKTNVNTDPWYVIAATTGMRLLTAQAICSHRNKYGKYKSLVDLLDVPRFGSTMLDKYGRMMEV